jgi:hypothetical protein
MIQKLGADWVPAHENRRCLVCHSTLEPTSASKMAQGSDRERLERSQHELLQDGVSCEACHGAAEKWLGPHTESTWRSAKTGADRSALGFVDLRSNLVERAQTCAKCHVGKAGRDVDHDLIAAGHPRLNFELSAYHANMPAHWDIKRDQQAFPVADQPDSSVLEAKLWVVGQLASAEAALDMLEARANEVHNREKPAPWPEFAEYGCFACHHDLQAPSWRQENPDPDRKPGRYSWGTWTFPLVTLASRTEARPSLSEALKKLDESLSQPFPKTPQVISQSKLAKELVSAELSRHHVANSLTPEQIRGLLLRVTAEGQQLSRRDWDAAAQVYLATVSLYEGQLYAEGRSVRLKLPSQSDRQLLVSLETMRNKLKFPQPPESKIQFASPQTFGSDRINLIREQLQKIADLVKQP